MLFSNTCHQSFQLIIRIIISAPGWLRPKLISIFTFFQNSPYRNPISCSEGRDCHKILGTNRLHSNMKKCRSSILDLVGCNSDISNYNHCVYCTGYTNNDTAETKQYSLSSFEHFEKLNNQHVMIKFFENTLKQGVIISFSSFRCV